MNNFKPAQTTFTTACIETWSSRQRWLLAAVMMMAIGGAYWNSLDAPFVFDDGPTIVENPTIRHLWGSWHTPENGSGAVGRPLVNVSFALNYAAGGLSVRGYHAVNIVLHCLAALTLWGLVRRTLRGLATAKAETIAFGTALCWALHPLLTESVTCIAQRNELMAGILYLFTLYSFVRSTESGSQQIGWSATSVAASLLGVLSKEIVVTAPVLIFLYDRTFISGSFALSWKQHKWFLLALLATWLPLTALVSAGAGRTGTVGFGLGVSAWEYLLTQCRAIALYLQLSLWPHPLIIDYGVPIVRDWSEVVGRGLLVLGLLMATLWALVKRPAAGFVGAFFFVILAPSSSVVPLTTQTIAEHRMYLPLVAIVMGCILAVGRIFSHGLNFVIGTVALALAIVTTQRNEVYRDEFRLWEQTIADLPTNPRGYSNLGNAYIRQRQWRPAIEQFRKAVQLRPDFADAHNNLGLALEEVGELESAIRHLETAARLKPNDADVRLNLGSAYLRAQDADRGIAQLSRATELRPGFANALQKKGVALLQTNRPTEAAAAFERAVLAAPAFVEALVGWGNSLLQIGRPTEAVDKYTAALRIAPQLPELHYNLANAFLQSDQLVEAETEYRKALTLNPSFAAAHHNLGLALLRAGRATEAVTQLRATLLQSPDSLIARVNLARALEESGQHDEAQVEARRALELDPDSSDARALIKGPTTRSVR